VANKLSERDPGGKNISPQGTIPAPEQVYFIIDKYFYIPLENIHTPNSKIFTRPEIYLFGIT
jgi:hypothetical protein